MKSKSCRTSLLALLCLLSFPVFGGSSWVQAAVVLSPNLTVTEAQVDDFARQLKPLTEDKIFYHWSDFATGMRWADQGRIDDGEVAALSSNHDNMAAGGGVYLADNPITSSDYGPFPTVFRIRKGTPLYDAAVAQKVFGRTLELNEKAALGQRVPFIHFYRADKGWYVTHHPANTREVTGGTLPQFKVAINFGNRASALAMTYIFSELAKNTHASQNYRNGLGFLSSFFQLMGYMDGIAVVRAITVNPNNPWAEFEPQRFESFRRTSEGYLYAALNQKNNGISKGGVFGDGTGASAWAIKQVDVIIKSINAQLSDRNIAQVEFRREGIRAGGSNLDNRFFASPGQVKVMEANPYLEVDKKASGDGFLVAYFYPDALHFSKVAAKGYLSPAFVKELQSYKPEVIFSNQTLRQQLNQRMMRELLLNLFTRLYGQSVDYTSSSGLAAILDFVSIHPFDDFNGRTTRFYSELAQLDSGREPARSYMSDFDLVTPPAVYGQFLKASTQQVNALKVQLMDETLSAIAQRRMPNLYGLSGWKNLSLSLAPFGLKQAVDFDSQDLELIRQRKFVELLDKLLKKQWNTRAMADPTWDAEMEWGLAS